MSGDLIAGASLILVLLFVAGLVVCAVLECRPRPGEGQAERRGPGGAERSDRAPHV